MNIKLCLIVPLLMLCANNSFCQTATNEKDLAAWNEAAGLLVTAMQSGTINKEENELREKMEATLHGLWNGNNCKVQQLVICFANSLANFVSQINDREVEEDLSLIHI